MTQEGMEFEYNYTMFESIPLKAINMSSRSILSKSLNIEQIIPSKDGHQRDYRGLAQLMEFPYNDLVRVQKSNDPTKVLFDSFLSTIKGHQSSIKDLILMLETIERYDVIDDVLESLGGDLKAFKDREQKLSIFKSTSEVCDLTIDDQNDKKSVYDAYVCYADADLEFVAFLAKFLESPDINLKLYIRERDPLIGNMEMEGFIEVLQSRCKRMLIVLSPDFLSSNECVFQSNVAQSLATNERKSRMLVPVIYKRCEVPTSINMLTKVDLSRANDTRLDWIWRRLVLSLAGPEQAKSINFKHLTAEYLAFLENNPKSQSSHDRIPSNVEPQTIAERSPSDPSTESLPPSYSEIYFPAVPSGPLTNVSTVSSIASLIPSKEKRGNWFSSMKKKITGTSNSSSAMKEPDVGQLT